MKHAKHSTGPWVFNAERTALTHNNGIKILDVTTGVEPISADARLIASAPDLLEALEALVKADVRFSTIKENLENEDDQNLFKLVASAIAKARGES